MTSSRAIRKNYAIGGVGMLSAMRAGLTDGMTPGGLALLLILAVVVVVGARWGLRPWKTGILFVVGVCLCRLLLMAGMLDWVLAVKPFDVFLDGAYLVFVVGCLLLGGIFWRDWWAGLRSPARRILVSAEFFSINESPRTRVAARSSRARLALVLTVGLRVLALLVGGFGAGLLAAAWPENADVFMQMAKFSSVRSWGGFFEIASVYLVAYVFLFIIVIGVVVGLLCSRAAFERVQKSFSMVQIILSAIFLAYGISFLSYYVNI